MPQEQHPVDLPLPPTLIRLIETGVWPSTEDRSMTWQESHKSYAVERVRRFAEDENLICLALPPFSTIAKQMSASRGGNFWERFGSLHQIVPEQALVIGDFGLGSDAPIILDYSRSMSDPPVLRLRWHAGGQTEWVDGASRFDQFAAMLGLIDVVE